MNMKNWLKSIFCTTPEQEGLAVIKKNAGCWSTPDLHLVLPDGREYVCAGGELAGNGSFNFRAPYGVSHQGGFSAQSLRLEHLKHAIKDELGYKVDNVVCEDGTSLEDLSFEGSKSVLRAAMEKARKKYGKLLQ